MHKPGLAEAPALDTGQDRLGLVEAPALDTEQDRLGPAEVLALDTDQGTLALAEAVPKNSAAAQVDCIAEEEGLEPNREEEVERSFRPGRCARPAMLLPTT